MAEKIKPELCQFLTAGSFPWKILIVESVNYLPELRQLFPQGQFYVAAAEADALDPYGALANGVEFANVDYRFERLPFPTRYFDYIISDLTLEQAGNPQDIAAGFSTYLKDTGSLLTSFRNIRHWSQLAALLDGHYYNVVARLYARPEFERLLYASYYKMVQVLPQKRPATSDIVERLTAVGFNNDRDDLNVEFWLVKADRSIPELALIKSMFTADERKRLSNYLHHIEYDVDPVNEIPKFWQFYNATGLFADYVASFVKQAVFHPERFIRRLWQYSNDAERTEIMIIMQWLAANALTREEKCLWQQLIDEYGQK